MAPTRAAVLIGGESGTGKELFARHIHERSGRGGAFVALNCAALPEALIESQLFGHKRGAFTGATEAQPGLIAAAHGGTLFLDEVGELPLGAQAKLLRVLQEQVVVPVGETRERRVDLRVVAASHRELRQLVADGRFREDLYHRLARFELTLPPLRARGRDVLLIARALLAGGLDGLPPVQLGRDADRLLLAHPWPGNVRELGNVLFRAALLAQDGVVHADALGVALGIAAPPPLPAPRDQVLAEVGAHGPQACSALAESLRLPLATTRRLLHALVEEGALRVYGVGRATRYALPVAKPVDAAADDPRAAAALHLLHTGGRLTRQALVESAGLAPRTAGRLLADLVERGLIVPDGRKGKAGGYVPASAA